MSNDRQPLYLQIQNHFKKLITTGVLVQGDKIPSEKELMEEFNVSRITVANALTQLAKDRWIYRIPGRGSYVQGKEEQKAEQSIPARFEGNEGVYGMITEERAVPHSAGHRRMIALLIPSMDDFFALRLIQGINSIIDESRFYLAIVLTNHSKEREKEAIVELVQKGAAGFIIFPIDAETYNEEILALKVRDFPFVLIDRYLPGVETNFVCSDSRKGSHLAVSHLWDLGHRDIAICSDSPLPTITVEERLAGYMEALKQKGAMINPALILTEFSVDYKNLDDDHALYRYIKNRFATAYITLNAKLGLRIASIARKLNMKVPGDISILTFDDPSSGIDDQGIYTHVAQSEEEIGSRAAQILIDRLIDPDKPSQYRKVILEPSLIVRKSTGPQLKEATK
ncbi:GntR family transcriptional regulator [Cohnella luojiensis]|uniref:GntR family transcriptional regulator n=1 Tax=Cohnella luojiensis TaxID=652876 RepID=A0A4Y8LRS7_9BACL|nr:substrate-binding domain-containing protein [Cohnella luojiensis]TFE22738.1 GntR family transcriptional regulator [Cohnella luojiensis]